MSQSCGTGPWDRYAKRCHSQQTPHQLFVLDPNIISEREPPALIFSTITPNSDLFVGMSVLSDSEDPQSVTKDLLNGIARQRRPIIAVDLDDVLCQTCVCAAECKHVYIIFDLSVSPIMTMERA